MYLKVSDLSFSYANSQKILEKISFYLTEGSTLFLQGENGVGKSTLLKIIAGILRPQEGSLKFFFNQACQSNQLFYQSYLASEYSGFELSMSADKNLFFALKIRGQKISLLDIRRVLSNWGFSSTYLVSMLPVGKFSTGMKRRLALAKIQIIAAKLWLLDEPSLALDEKALNKLVDLLEEHKRKGGITLFSSHDLNFSQKVASQILSLP